jgi:tetratricopeptide (TPR) repeat protein
MADYAVSHSAAIIEAAISVFEEVLRLRPRGKEHRAEALGDLGDALELFCVHNETDQSRRSRCFDLLREALQLCPPGHSSRERVLHSLARALHFVGYERQGDLENLRESILLNRAAMQLRPPGHCKRGDSLNNLACGLARLFEHCGDLNLLAEAITLLREQLELRPVGHPNRDTFLHNLAHALHASFEYQGGSETIAEAISIYRDTLQLRPVGHPLRWATLSDFSHALSLSHAPKGFLESSSESTSLSREAVELLPSTHPGRGPVLGYLGQHLVARYRQCHDHSAIAEGIALLRESLSLLTGHPGHAEVLNNLAEALIASFDAHGRFDHLLEAVMLRREALGHRPPGHSQRMESLQRLARLLCRPECQSWTEALALYYEAMNICPIGSRLRSEMLSDASICFLDPESPFFDLSQGLEHLTAAYSDNFSHVNQRLRSAMSDLARIERAYNKAVTNLDGPSVEHCKIQVLNLYAQVIALLPRAANFGLDHNTRLQAITGLDQISRDAAARAILLGHASQALEMLEEGRGVFWAQSLHLRYSAFEDVPPEDSQELQRILRLLEYTARRAESPDHNAAQRERDLEMRRQLNDEAESLILKIRGYPGFNRFLLPSAFDALVSALPDGFVVIVNASKLGNHALLLHKGTALATCLKLQPPPTGFDSTTLRSQLPRDMASSTDEGDTRAMRKIVSCEGSFLDVLAVLWNTIVQPIVTQLGLQVSYKCAYENSY